MDRPEPAPLSERDPREVCETAGLRHFQSKLRVTSGHCAATRRPGSPAASDACCGLVCRAARNGWTVSREYRTLLKVPGFFGALLGFSHDGTQHFVVSIRGLGWEGNVVHLPSGCSIAGGSAFDHEWREFGLKREAVVRLLGCG